MTVKLGSNIASLISQRRLAETSQSLSGIYERLSSGQRINRASDDAAGLAIADSLNSKSRIYTQAIRNGNDGISLLNIADSAIAALSDVVVRIRELSEQSANGSYSDKQRQAIDAEAQQLSKEFTRISQTTSFNSINIFSGSLGNGLQLQLGEGTDAILNASIGGAIGTGQFGSATIYSTSGGSTHESELVDLNNDGILDLINTSTFKIETRLGLGDGTFGSSVVYSTYNQNNWSQTLADLNNDSVLDWISAGDGNKLEIRMGLGNGTFGTATNYTTLSSINYMTSVGDLNGDGNLDLIAGGSGNNFEVRLGLGNGSFAARTIYSTTGSLSFSANLGDLNGDNILDLITAGNSNYYEIRLGKGDGSFYGPTSYTTGSSINFTSELTDLNGDNLLDLITAGVGRAEVRLGLGNGTFGSASIYSTSNISIRELSFDDLNGDGFWDMVSAEQNNSIGIRLGQGDGTFGAVSNYTTLSSLNLSIASGDINNDGVTDIITAGGNLEVRFASTKDGLGALASFSLKTKYDSLQAMSVLDTSISNLAKQRGQIGASLSRVSVAISNLESSRENFKAAESRIRDADIAADAAQLIRTQILQQAASAVLSQANAQPQLALQLLR